MPNFIRCILVGAVVIGTWGCVSKEWHSTEIPVPGHDTKVYYYRKILPDFVGAEHEREL